MVAVSLKKFFFKQKTAYEIELRLVGSEMCIRDREEVIVHPQRMLNRILSIPDSATDLATYMKYELAPRPSSLFDDMSMR